MKNRNNSRSQSIVSTLIVVLTIALLVITAQAGRVQALTLQVNSTYQKSFYETISYIEDIEMNLEKLLITGSSAKEQELLSTIARQSDSAQDNLSMLSSSAPAVSSSIKFVNQTGDFTRTLSERLAAGGAVSDKDRELLTLLRQNCSQLKEALISMTEGNLPVQNLSGSSESAITFTATGSSETEPSIKYPSLLYDGPFSDGRENGILRAAGSTEFTADEALTCAVEFVGKDRVLSSEVTGEGVTPVPCHEITLLTGEGELNLAVTRQGGEIIYMVFSGQTGPAKFPQVELIDLASSFLKSRGYPNVAVSYWSFLNGILTVNFAAVQDGVILYPDLIKVQMNASTGHVIGLEALSYLSNHIYRPDLTPLLSAEEAGSLLGQLLTTDRSRLCVIPTDSGEALAWEFDCSYGNSRYLVYIDAKTGREHEIYRVIEDEYGQLVI